MDVLDRISNVIVLFVLRNVPKLIRALIHGDGVGIDVPRPQCNPRGACCRPQVLLVPDRHRYFARRHRAYLMIAGHYLGYPRRGAAHKDVLQGGIETQTGRKESSDSGGCRGQEWRASLVRTSQRELSSIPWERNRRRVVKFSCTRGRNITGGGLTKPKSGPPKPLTPPRKQPWKKRPAFGSRCSTRRTASGKTILRGRQCSAWHGTYTAISR